MAAFFAAKEGGRIYVLKLMKLLYLADRESLDQYGAPISFDRMVSMPDGPVLSGTLNLINGSVNGPEADHWEEWITDRDNYQVGLVKALARDQLDELSDADLAVLEKVWLNFGHMGRYEIRNYTHDHLPEWQDPNGSSFPIGTAAVLRALGKNEDQVNATAQSLREHDEISTRLNSA